MSSVHIACVRCRRGLGIRFVSKILPTFYKVCRRCGDEFLISLARNEEGKVEATFELVLRKNPVTAKEREMAQIAGDRPAAAD